MLKKILIVLLLTGFVNADDFENGINAAKKKDYKTASKSFQKACNTGKVQGCYILGAMFDEGTGVQQDSFKAAKLYQKACDGAIASGCYNLGLLYYNGDGVKQDSLKAVGLFKKACDGGDASGCNNLGVIYANGFRDKQSYEHALKYFAKACDMKYEEGCKNYARLKKKIIRVLVSSNHIYYENSDIPINKLDIHDSQLIHEIEHELLPKSYEHKLSHLMIQLYYENVS